MFKNNIILGEIRNDSIGQWWDEKLGIEGHPVLNLYTCTHATYAYMAQAAYNMIL